MIYHITPDELNKLNMLLFLQRRAGIKTSFSILIEGWRALSEPAKAHVIEAYNGMVEHCRTFEAKGEFHDAPSSATSTANR